jgi:hypothetical protein
MDTNPKSPEKESNSPSPKVSASKYPGAQAKAFPVRFRIKGADDGPVFEGQRQIRICKSCGQ